METMLEKVKTAEPKGQNSRAQRSKLQRPNIKTPVLNGQNSRVQSYDVIYIWKYI